MVDSLPGLREPFDVAKTASDDADIAYLSEHEIGPPDRCHYLQSNLRSEH